MKALECVPRSFVDTFIVTTAGARSRVEELMMDRCDGARVGTIENIDQDPGPASCHHDPPGHPHHHTSPSPHGPE